MSEEYWAIKTPKGNYERTQRATDEDDMWRRAYLVEHSAFAFEEGFQAFRNRGENSGFKAVKVKIVEVEE